MVTISRIYPRKRCEMRDIYNRKQRLNYCIARIDSDFSGKDKTDLLKFEQPSWIIEPSSWKAKHIFAKDLWINDFDFDSAFSSVSASIVTVICFWLFSVREYKTSFSSSRYYFLSLKIPFNPIALKETLNLVKFYSYNLLLLRYIPLVIFQFLSFI